MQMEFRPIRREPLINAPWVVIAVAALLVGLHGAASIAPREEQLDILLSFALIPARFHSGDPVTAEAWLTFLSSALLHGGWMHVLVNAGMLLALGSPPGRYFGSSITGAGKWMILFLASVAGGSALYVALNGVDGAPAVGASGGVSGMFAAAFLLHPQGGLRSLLDRQFLSMTAAFALANIALVVIGPLALGGGVAWEAHAGGYLAGALTMMLVGARPGR